MAIITKVIATPKYDRIFTATLGSISFFQITPTMVRTPIPTADIKTAREPFVGNELITIIRTISDMLILNFVGIFEARAMEKAAIRNAPKPVTYEKVPLARVRSRILGTEYNPPRTAWLNIEPWGA